MACRETWTDVGGPEQTDNKKKIYLEQRPESGRH